MKDRASTGIEGFDEILGGGLPRNRIYLVQGDPGVGKTTLGLQFLMAGAKAGEKSLYITLSETREEIDDVPSSPRCVAGAASTKDARRSRGATSSSRCSATSYAIRSVP